MSNQDDQTQSSTDSDDPVENIGGNFKLRWQSMGESRHQSLSGVWYHA